MVLAACEVLAVAAVALHSIHAPLTETVCPEQLITIMFPTSHRLTETDMVILKGISSCTVQVPVRAVVLPLLDHEAAMMIHTSVRHALHSLLTEDSIWWQDELLMHATLYHASTHAVSIGKQSNMWRAMQNPWFACITYLH
eukprot:GHRR01032536.1.p1 GENE.GHRR01032536.1~~GHRR01032536.1.p1  ORF type:complete len:141 (-),score=30.25 GHRR01032536.1:107-529(-)